jgi:hypothetical protein
MFKSATQPKLTPTEQKVYQFISDMITQRCLPPTVREICNKFGYKSSNAAHQLLCQLELKGAIRRKGGKLRGIELVKDFEMPTLAPTNATLQVILPESLKPVPTPNPDKQLLRTYKIYMKSGNIISIIASRIHKTQGIKKTFFAYDEFGKLIPEIDINVDEIDAIIPSEMIIYDQQNIDNPRRQAVSLYR